MTHNDERLAQLRMWLTEHLDTEPGVPQTASADASFRRYFRIPTADGSVIAMDSPPEREDPTPFVRIAELLRAAGLHAPRILAQDLEQGFLLLEDLGDRTYLQAISDDPQTADSLYDDALGALAQWQAATRADALNTYDRERLQEELELFPTWYVREHLGHEPDASWQADWTDTCNRLIAGMEAQPQVYVHRDYTPRNLMVAAPNPGIIDFQDAVIGPIAYDWVSLVRDAFVSWPVGTEERWLQRYRQHAIAAGVGVPSDPSDLRRAIDTTAAQRHLKVIGIFARLWHRDGKPGYLPDIPRFFTYLERESRPWPELAPLRRLLAALPQGDAACGP